MQSATSRELIATSCQSATFQIAPCGNAEDMGEGMFAPDSVTWRVHADPSMLIGGMRALLVQALHPLAMAGVEQHSDYRADPWGRLRNTVEYVMTTTYGTEEEARQAGRVVQAIHKRVRGTDPGRRRGRADASAPASHARDSLGAAGRRGRARGSHGPHQGHGRAARPAPGAGGAGSLGRSRSGLSRTTSAGCCGRRCPTRTR